MTQDEHIIVERTYRRGVHQALCLATVLAERATSLAEARELIGSAEDEAQALRNVPARELCAGPIIDVIHGRVHAKRLVLDI